MGRRIEIGDRVKCTRSHIRYFIGLEGVVTGFGEIYGDEMIQVKFFNVPNGKRDSRLMREYNLLLLKNYVEYELTNYEEWTED